MVVTRDGSKRYVSSFFGQVFLHQYYQANLQDVDYPIVVVLIGSTPNI